MGDLAEDTAVEKIGDGRYRATLSRDWEIWGPNGGGGFVTDGMDSLEHDHATPPGVPHWSELKPIEDLVPPGSPRRSRFWDNFDQRPIIWMDDWENRPAGEPTWQQWIRYRPTATFPDDPSADAARLVVMLDTVSWPSAVQAHTGMVPWMAPSLDLNVQFPRR